MPYKIEENEGKFEVINTDTEEVKGSHPSKAKAEAQMRALYANENKSMKIGARNNKQDIDRLNQIKVIVDELIGAGMEEVEAEEAAGKGMDLSYANNFTTENIMAVKSIGEGIIKGYITLWGSAKLTDVELEYFTPETNFWDNILAKAARPLTWDHAQDDSFYADPIIGQITEMGDDEIGRWYVAKLDRSHRYNKAIERLIAEGKLGTSSDSAPQYVERVKTGKATWLKTWPLFAAALTDTPAEPRMVGSLEYLKSLGVELPDDHKHGWQWLVNRMKRNKL